MTERPSSSPLVFRWLGVGGLEFSMQGRILLVDPFLSRPSFWQILFSPLQPNTSLIRTNLPRADVILITHSHYDHLMDVPEIMRYTHSEAYGSPLAMQLIQLSGISPQRCHAVQAGIKQLVGMFQFQVFEGGHIFIPFFRRKEQSKKRTPPLRVWDYQMDACFSYRLSVAGHSLLIWHNMSGADAPPADVLFFDTEISSQELEALLQNVQPRLVVPIHWDNFFRPISLPLQPFFRPTHQIFPPFARINLKNIAGLIKEITPHSQIILPEPLIAVTLFSG
jgi:L-ascorbate metabolism protein UlaG (beta-lactamase superfamily)